VSSIVQDRGQPIILTIKLGSAITEMLNDLVNVLREAVGITATRQGSAQALHQRIELCFPQLRPLLFDLLFMRGSPINKYTLQASNDNDGQDDALIFVALNFPQSHSADFQNSLVFVELRLIQRLRRLISFANQLLHDLPAVPSPF
jgi:hypothetical protein